MISRSRFIPVLLLTAFFTLSINFSISDEFAFPLFTKKLQCFLEIVASPSLNLSEPVSFINCQAFFSLLRFLKVLPHVLIWLGWDIFFFSINENCYFSIISLFFISPLSVTEVWSNHLGKLVPLYKNFISSEFISFSSHVLISIALIETKTLEMSFP